MRHSFPRIALAGGIAAAVLVAGHNATLGTSGALGFAAGSIVGSQLGHATGALGSRHGATNGAHSAAKPGRSVPGGALSGSSRTGATVNGVTDANVVNTGLLERSPSPPPPNLGAYVNGYIAEAPWNVLQPSPGTLVTTRIDREVAAVRTWNAANPDNQRGLRLRITAGFNTPTWALGLGGPAVHLCSTSGTCGLVPRWWTAPVQTAYQAFTARLAAYANNIPEIREVTVGLTMVRWGEIMVRFPTAAGNAAAYRAAGYTEALDIAAMRAEINDGRAFHAVTQIDVADYQTPSSGQDINVSKAIMDYAVATLRHVQFANASITQNAGQNAAIFALMQTYGPRGNATASITFQTYPVLSNVTQTLDRAIAYGACSVEMPPGGVSPTLAAGFDLQLRANCTAMGIRVPNTPTSGSLAPSSIAPTAAGISEGW